MKNEKEWEGIFDFIEGSYTVDTHGLKAFISSKLSQEREDTLQEILSAIDKFKFRVKRSDRVRFNPINIERRSGFYSCMDRIKNIIKKKLINNLQKND